MAKELICSQCNQVITEAYINKGTWVQCFDCYCEEEESFDIIDDDQSYYDEEE